MSKLILLWIFLLSASVSFGQSEVSIPGTYILKEEIGAHFVPGMSFGDLHVTSYNSSIDTIITHTIVLDSLHKATFTRDTLLHMNVHDAVKIKMTGNWSVQNDTLTIRYTKVDTIYPYIQVLKFKGTINGADYELIPDKAEESSPLEKEIFEQYDVLIFENTRYLGSEENKITEKYIDAIAPTNRKEEWIKFRKQ